MNTQLLKFERKQGHINQYSIYLHISFDNIFFKLFEALTL